MTEVEYRKNPYGGWYWTVTRDDNRIGGYCSTLGGAKWKVWWAIRELNRARRRNYKVSYIT